MAEVAKTDEQKQDEKLQKEARERSEARTKLVDDIVAGLHKELDKGNVDQVGLQSIIAEVQTKIGAFQVIAAGAEYGPSPARLEELKKSEFPVLAKPMSDGTPVANIAQASKKEDKQAAKK